MPKLVLYRKIDVAVTTLRTSPVSAGPMICDDCGRLYHQSRRRVCCVGVNLGFSQNMFLNLRQMIERTLY